MLMPVASRLEHPWGLAFLPDGTALVTERPGRLRRINIKTGKVSAPIAGVPTVLALEQGGLLGIVLDPNFGANRRVFLSFAEKRASKSVTAVWRATFNAAYTRLEGGKVIFRQSSPVAGGKHYGARLVFDSKGHLFVTTGDRGTKPEQAQNKASHLGKVLRITVDGRPAPGNPVRAGWAPEVWSIGHRNLQGATRHPTTNELWTVEHGAKGGDELNTPKAGKNYGWPIISYGTNYDGSKIGVGTSKPGMEQPLHYWDPSIAPSGLTFYTGTRYPGWKGNLFVGALSGQHIARLTLSGKKVVAETQLFKGTHRFRDIVQGPDGWLYVLTDAPMPQGGMYRMVLA
jgi:aldose sugar dehydrogenase